MSTNGSYEHYSDKFCCTGFLSQKKLFVGRQVKKTRPIAKSCVPILRHEKQSAFAQPKLMVLFSIYKKKSSKK